MANIKSPKVRTVTLELLRHGPAHNQLLSPLTTYMGLCGAHEISAITIPLEHRQLLDRLALFHATEPPAPESTPPTAFDELADTMTAILEANPGLVSQLHASNGCDHTSTLIELRLVLSATELALLPFEISKVPKGCIGSSALHLGLQDLAPTCITRSSRTLQSMPVNWNRTPSILFISAGVSDTLHRHHLHALFKALDPWLPLSTSPDEESASTEQRKEQLDKYLTVIANGDLDRITEVCSNKSFTHVHILSHGVADDSLGAGPGGLLLCNRHGAGPVTAERLYNALTNHGKGPAGGGPPLVITLASCHTGHAGNILYSHGSFAHQLHEKGVPVVIASQFPLSATGSVHMAEIIYRHLMKGSDPRLALYKTRKALNARPSPYLHDWASLVGYMALPENFAEQLVDFQYRQAKAALDNSLAALDGSPVDQADDLIKYVDRAMQWMPDDPAYATEVVALKGAVAKRKAEMYFRQATGSGKNDEKLLQESKRQLTRAIGCYRQAARQSVAEGEGIIRKKRALHWSLTQYLVLMAIAHGTFREKEWQQWNAAMFSARVDMKNREGTEIWSWAVASAMELHLLRYVLKEICPDKGEKIDSKRNKEKQESLHWAYKLACKLHRNCENPFILNSTCRQLERYGNWWREMKYFCLTDENTAESIQTIRCSLADYAEELRKILTSDYSSCPGSRP